MAGDALVKKGKNVRLSLVTDLTLLLAAVARYLSLLF